MQVPERRLAFAAALLLAAVPWVYFWRGATMQVLLGDGDTFVQFLPTWTWAAAQWKALTPPLWTPYLYSGFPLFADPTAAVFHPLQFLFMLLPPVVALNLVVLVYFGVAGLVTFLVGRQEGLTVEASFLGGVVFAYGGFLLGHQGITPLLMTVAALPTVFWALGRLRRRPGWGSCALLALTLAHLVLCGHPQFTFYALVCGAAYALRLAWEAPPAERRTLLRLGAAAGVVGLGLVAVQLLPTAELMGYSVRDRLDYEAFAGPANTPFHLFASLLSTRLLTLLPADGTEARLDVGALPLVLVLAAVVLAARRSRFWIGMLAVSSLLWLGDTTPLYRLMFHVPGYNAFRIASRNGMMVAFAVAILAAFGADALERRRNLHRPALRWAALAALPVVDYFGWNVAGARAFGPLWRATVGTHHPWGWEALEPILPALVPTLSVIAAATVVVALCLWLGRGSRWLTVMAIVLAAAHFWVYRGWIFVAPVEQIDASLRPGAAEPVLASPPEAGAAAFRIALGAPASWVTFWKHDTAGWRPVYVRAGGVDVNLLHGVASIGGYSPMMLRDYARFAGDMEMWGGPADSSLFSSAALDLLNVRFVVAPEEGVGYGPGAFRGLQLFAESGGLRFYRNPTAAGLAWGVEEVAIADDPAAKVRAAPRGDPEARSTALVGREDSELAGRPFARPARLAARHLGPNRVALEVAAPGEAFVATSLLRYPGWRATVDGERVELLRVNGLFQGLVVPAGRHRVLLRYLPASFLWGLAVTALAAAVLVGGTVVDRRRRRRRQPPSPD